MENLLYEYFLYFGRQTGIEEALIGETQFIFLLIVVFGIINCFLGFKVYRFFFSVVMFSVSTIIICLLLNGYAHWGVIVTTFSIVGVFIAFFAFNWLRLGAFVITGIIMGSVVFILGGEVWVSIVLGIVTGLLSLSYPVLLLIVTTALFGSQIIVDYLQRISWIVNNDYWTVTLYVTLLGMGIQYFMNRNQRLLIDQSLFFTKQ
jgi:hypothetical protein